MLSLLLFRVAHVQIAFEFGKKSSLNWEKGDLSWGPRHSERAADATTHSYCTPDSGIDFVVQMQCSMVDDH